MKDTREDSLEQQELSNGSSNAQSTREIKEKLWAEIIKTAVFAFVSLFVIVLGSIAWFVSNSKADAGGIKVSHQFDTIKLATTGKRQEKEEKLLNLKEGETMSYDDETYYWTEAEEIALRLSDPSVAVSPGMSGEISFYIIPDRTGPQTVTLHLRLAGYEEIEMEGSSNTGKKIDDLVLNSLLSGHILLFKICDGSQYSNWIKGSPSEVGVDYQITVTNRNAQKDVPWLVTIYWIWPLRYINIANDFKVGDTNILTEFINNQAGTLNKIESTDYFYSQIFLTKNDKLESVDSRSDAYNQADEYIGTKANYLYVTVQTDLVN